MVIWATSINHFSADVLTLISVIDMIHIVSLYEQQYFYTFSIFSLLTLQCLTLLFTTHATIRLHIFPKSHTRTNHTFTSHHIKYITCSHINMYKTLYPEENILCLHNKHKNRKYEYYFYYFFLALAFLVRFPLSCSLLNVALSYVV